jgi:hypothetical protein
LLALALSMEPGTVLTNVGWKAAEPTSGWRSLWLGGGTAPMGGGNALRARRSGGRGHSEFGTRDCMYVCTVCRS